MRLTRPRNTFGQARRLHPLPCCVAWGLSAGRVQSVAATLGKRERERRAFRGGSYWDLKSIFEQERHRLQPTGQTGRN